MKLKFYHWLMISALILIPFWGLHAATNNDSVFISADETITGNLFAISPDVTIDGTISGDLIVAGRSIIVNGRVEGDVIAAGQNITINGEVGGNVRVVGNYVVIGANVARNINAFGTDVIIDEKARVGWDALTGGSIVRIDGHIFGSLHSYAQKIIFAGKVGKNAGFTIYGNTQEQEIVIDKNATINGDLTYSAKKPANLNGSTISGQINFKEIADDKKEDNRWAIWAWGRLFSLLSMLFIGLIFVFIIPGYSQRLISEIKERTVRTLLLGAIFTLLAPVLALILLLSVIGIPLAVSLLGLWAAGIFLAKTVTAFVLGDIILKDLFKRQQPHLFWSLLLGAFIIALLFSLPYAGNIFRLIAVCFGLGAIISYATNKLKNI